MAAEYAARKSLDGMQSSTVRRCCDPAGLYKVVRTDSLIENGAGRNHAVVLSAARLPPVHPEPESQSSS